MMYRVSLKSNNLEQFNGLDIIHATPIYKKAKDFPTAEKEREWIELNSKQILAIPCGMAYKLYKQEFKYESVFGRNNFINLVCNVLNVTTTNKRVGGKLQLVFVDKLPNL